MNQEKQGQAGKTQKLTRDLIYSQQRRARRTI